MLRDHALGGKHRRMIVGACSMQGLVLTLFIEVNFWWKTPIIYVE